MRLIRRVGSDVFFGQDYRFNGISFWVCPDQPWELHPNISLLEKAVTSGYSNFMSAADLQKMSTAERLQAMEALWDALCHEPEEPKSPEWHRGVLAERKRRIQSGEAKFVSIEEARERLHG